eukprot:CAMPEP_0198659382 /NCGR_PEP_ID=MMETSP1467-20131203/31406_1 /TAXON_ID=1462469 /ORGANISM="unid. sp., Strain CCMP2135" /LENGTH=383 /DNA_ID=CAMNT_0044395723 /DNA_START=14 /DNA_END=1165 /DNA_ORIENTATION=+
MDQRRVMFLTLTCLFVVGSPSSYRPAPLDPYRVLGVSSKASEVQIKKAYYERAKSTHPDKRPAEERTVAEREFKEINQAWEMLRNNRAAIDEARKRGPPGNTRRPRRGGTVQGSYQEAQVVVRLGLEAVLKGGSTTVPITVPISRFSSVVYMLPLSFEPGLRDGDVISRHSAPGLGGIVAVASIRSHSFFKPRGDDLYCTVWVSCLGVERRTNLKVRPLDAPPFPWPFFAPVVVPVSRKSLRDGVRLCARGFGLPARKPSARSGRGDLFVTVKVRSLRVSAAVLAAQLSPFLVLASTLGFLLTKRKAGFASPSHPENTPILETDSSVSDARHRTARAWRTLGAGLGTAIRAMDSVVRLDALFRGDNAGWRPSSLFFLPSAISW